MKKSPAKWAKRFWEVFPGRSSDSFSLVADVPGGVPRPAMSPAEIVLLQNSFAKSRNYLEFGSGGSTFLAIETPVEMCWSVDSDAGWIAKMREWEPIRNAEASGQLKFHHADIGRVQALGVPIDRTPKASWSSYFLRVWGKLDEPPDLVLVDGRFRLGCALATLLACPEDTALLIHDFGDFSGFRRNYRLILDFADVETTSGKLARLRRKRDFSAMKALALLDFARTDLV